jgi:Tol biopolymer transport system component
VVGEEGNPAYNWPCLSPDNRRIAFARYEDLYVMNVDGSDLQRLDVMSGLLPPNGNTDFVWSPDSRSIVYTGHDEWDGNPASPDVEAALCVIGADGTGWRCLVVYPGYEDNVNKLTPAWAPDGQWVYFVMCDDEENYEHIYRIRPDGSDMQCLVGEAYELFTIDELNLPLLPQRA